MEIQEIIKELREHLKKKVKEKVIDKNSAVLIELFLENFELHKSMKKLNKPTKVNLNKLKEKIKG